ncbi:energy-coupling factor transporter transmembrane component T [Sulfitobacter sp. R18_1]|uniref:energy-coupling factor transporter transmembrane component T n=1 Tax=Sulfitobacter sp. R18_1 TaxID=2821104 RepID=UPI001ADC9DA7|nr:energy-coupling factor transporter transmembrane component T [Sulfitobacter sp. R18_1]MBO9428943.1 energy-coupling factor transporter transmembrane protein EcfT [Sulfitobacter sp. R18_1]
MISLTSPVETRAHGWPAGVKLGALCLATLLLFGVEEPVWQILFCAGMLLLYALPGRAFLRAGLGRLWMLWPFVGLILLWHVLTDDAEAGLVIALRMITAVGLANLVTMTTKLSDMMGVVHWLAAPLRRFGLRTRSLELAVALVVRFTPVLAAKGQMLSLAWRARSRRRAGWRVVMPFTVLAIDDAEHVAEALRARGGL